MSSNTVYVSIDIETTGPNPHIHSMIELGATAHTEDGTEICSFDAKIEEYGCRRESTYNWWTQCDDDEGKRRRQHWDYLHENPSSIQEAMKRFSNWINVLKENNTSIIFIAYPVSFDITFLYYLWTKYVDDEPINGPGVFMHAIDIESYFLHKYKHEQNYRNIDELCDKFASKSLKYTHKALDDARYQASIFFNFNNLD